MLKELKFVQGAVAKKDLLPALTHFKIENGTVRSFNGTLALCSPIALDIECTPKAIPFVSAIQACKDTVVLSMTPAGRLSVKSGSFKAFIECVDIETPHVEPEGEVMEVDGATLLKALNALWPIIGDDASRPWSNGVLLDGESAFATNNVILAEYWLAAKFPVKCNVPRQAIRELIRIGEPPISVQATDRSISFHFEDGRWVRSALLETCWPDVRRVLACNLEELVPIEQELFEALETLKPFIDKFGRIYLNPGNLTTAPLVEGGEGGPSAGEGAVFAAPWCQHTALFSHAMLWALRGLATHINFNEYPAPCHFYGEGLRGAIIGMKLYES